MNPIPCDSCQMPGGCRQDKKCRRPAGLDHSIREVKEAGIAVEAAVNRLHHALAGLSAALVIHKAQE